MKFHDKNVVRFSLRIPKDIHDKLIALLSAMRLRPSINDYILTLLISQFSKVKSKNELL